MGRIINALVNYTLRRIRWIVDWISYVYGIIFWPSKKNFLKPIDNELLLLPAVEAANRIKAGKLKSFDLVRAYVNRAKQVQRDLNAMVDSDYTHALEQAREIDERVERELNGEKPSGEKSIYEYPFLGVPFTAKNSIRVKGLTYSGGVYARKDMKGESDSVAVERMKKVGGAIFLGLTNVPECIMWQDSFNRVDGRTNNPYDKSRIPGGSSGGEGALIAAAGSVIGIGSDIAGSIRIPSHCCGIFGHKSTPRSISNEGVFPEYSLIRQGINTLGPMCRYACDLRPMLQILAGDKLDLPKNQSLELPNLKVHYMVELPDPLISPVDKEIKQGIHKLVQFFSQKGSKTFELDTVGKFADFRHAFFVWCAAMYDPDHKPFLDFITNGNPESVRPLRELLKCALGIQRKYTASVMTFAMNEKLGLMTIKQEQFKEMWQRLKSEIHGLLEPNTIIICPTFPEIAMKHNESFSKFSHFSYTALWSAMNVAITNVPLGLDRHGMPFGVQIIAGPQNDNLTIQVAEELERKFGGWIPPCPVTVGRNGVH